MYIELKEIYEQANESFIHDEIDLFNSQVSERTLCGSLMLHLDRKIRTTTYSNYKVDVEYNRNKDGKIKTIVESIDKVVTINCDLIVHSRGISTIQDNLIAFEMKKSTRTTDEKNKDRYRLIALTKNSYDDVWSYDGSTHPEHVCGYILGIYYEINYNKREILVEYYKDGLLHEEETIIY